MKKLLALLFLAVPSFAGIHVQQNDPSLTIGSMTLTTITSGGIKFADGTVQITSAPAGGASSGFVTLSTNSHIITNGALPSLINCGSNPSVNGDDNSGLISVGGGFPSICVLQFAGNWGITPKCRGTGVNNIVVGTNVTSSTSTTFSFSSPPGGINYNCQCVGAAGTCF